MNLGPEGALPALSVPAPAKLNLFLHITGRRDDGYHELQTVFQFVDHGDQLRYQLTEQHDIHLSGTPAGWKPDQDLVVRAARLLQRETGSRFGALIDCDKHLPVGAGLGGGSSDAASTLHALNRLWQTDLGIDELADMGLALGADVPVFIRGHACFATGVGEQMTALALPEPWFVVLVPPVAVATADIFADPALTRDCAPITIRDFLSGAGSNVCEAVVRSRCPEVDITLRWLADEIDKHQQQTGVTVVYPPRMTGTGSCVFAAFETREEARALLQSACGGQPVLPSGTGGFVARGRNLSPLHVALGIATGPDTGVGG